MFAPHDILIPVGVQHRWWRAAVLGAVQGVTEFLPVSSSGHLVLFEHLLGVRRPGLALETGLHLGTLGAVVFEYRADLWAAMRGLGGTATGDDAGLLWWLAVASIPAAVVGVALRRLVDPLFGSLPATAVAWCLTGVALLGAGRRVPGARRLSDLRLGDALWIGTAQALALAPGVSRSGATIVAALARDLAPGEAARFGFLLSLPVIGGAALLHARDLAAGGGGAIWLGAVVAGATGLTAIRMAAARVRAGAIGSFGWYCLALGILVVLRAALTGEWR